MATVQEWDDFTQDAAQKLETARQNMENVLNDPSASQARKEEARTNYQKQKMYYDQLAAKNEEVQLSGIAPVSWTVDAETAGSALYQWSDSKYYPVEVGYPLSGKLSDTFKFVSSEHFDIEVSYTYPSAATNNAMVSKTSNYPPSGINIGYFGLQPGTGGSWIGYFSWTARDLKGNLTSVTKNFNYDSGYTPHPCCAISPTTIPSLYAGRSVGIGTWNGDVQTQLIAGGYIDVSIPAGTVDDPWDYYNDILMPTINPDDRMYPNGYEPEPDPSSDPGDTEPIDTPVITGDDMELQTDRTLTAPSDFITMYMITPPILSQFGRTLWTSLANYNPQDPTSADVFKNFYAVLNEQVTGSLDIGSIMNFIISVRQYPFAVSDITNIYELVGNSISFGTGALPIECGSAAQVYRLTSTIGVLDLGSVTIADYSDFKLYNDFRDYYNTSVSAYLPYCGTVELNPIEAINSTIHCFYAIDFYTGECTAFLTTTSEDGHTIISGSKSGTIGVLVPITATNSGQVAARHLSDNAKDSMLITSAAGNLFGMVGNLATGNVMGAVGNATGLAQIGAQQKMLDAERQGRSAVMAPSLSGGVGAAAFVSPATASILVRRGTYARQKITNYPQTCGYPETSSGQLKTYKGYTECYNVNVDSINCTEEEKAAIKLALESGVYLPTDL